MTRRYLAELYAYGPEDGLTLTVDEDMLRTGLPVKRTVGKQLDGPWQTAHQVNVRFEWDGTCTAEGRPRFREVRP